RCWVCQRLLQVRDSRLTVARTCLARLSSPSTSRARASRSLRISLTMVGLRYCFPLGHRAATIPESVVWVNGSELDHENSLSRFSFSTRKTQQFPYKGAV